MGLEFYATRSPGVAGQLKATADDFEVTEIASYPRPDPDGGFTVLRVRSENWEQHELARAIERRLGLAPHSVKWAGTKDRRARSERLLSYRGPPLEGDLHLDRVEVVEAYRARDGLVLGHHYGNSFRIRVGNLAAGPGEARAAYAGIERELRELGGFPNLFGPQRFGEVRPVTASVGRALVRGDVAAAVEEYLVTLPPGTPPGPGDAARAAYGASRDAARALVEYPPEYTFERSLLDHLARGHGPDRALRALPRELRLLFVHAYQSLLFNRWLSRRHGEGLPFDRPVVGDRIVRFERDGTLRARDASRVGPDNLTECADLVARGRALVAGSLVGFETPRDPGRPGELLAEILVEEGVEPDQFRLPVAPEVASAGAWRPIEVPLPPLSIEPSEESVTFAFALPRGSYATVLLREFLKRGASA